VETAAGAAYEAIDDQGLHCNVKCEKRVPDVDNLIVRAGQESNREFHDALRLRGIQAHLIGEAPFLPRGANPIHRCPVGCATAPTRRGCAFTLHLYDHSTRAP